MARVHVTHEFSKPVDRVYAYLAHHENLSKVFGAKVALVKPGDTERNGVGSVRSLKIGPLPAFEETVFEAVPNEKILYRITKGSPLRNHVGTMRFSQRPGGGSALDYVIEFGAVVPGLDKVVAAGLGKSVKKGMATVEREA